MRLTLLTILCLNLLHADSVQKIWTTPHSEMIESTEGMVQTQTASLDGKVEPFLQTLPQGRNLDDIPLAKLYPVKQTIEAKSAASSRDVSYTSGGISGAKERKSVHAGSNEEKIDRLQKMVERQLAVKEKRPQPSERVVSGNIESASPTSTAWTKPHLSGSSSWQILLSRQYILWGLLAAFGLLLMTLSILGIRRSRQKVKEAEFDNPVMEEALASKNLLQQFMALRGEVHMRFLERKQNILFHEEFTQYQKAKALLDLEKRYTRLEYIELPKLFSEELETFTEGQRALTSQPELQEITLRFIRRVMQKSDFTKAQKSEILKNLKNHYRTPNHTWDCDENIKEEVEASQLDYLLQ